MNTIDDFLNAAAVWFVLKAVEVVPFAFYDLFVLINECFSKTEDNSGDQPRLKHRFDRRRGRFDFVFSGAGFFRFSSCQRSKRMFLIASLVPILIFVLEIFSIFLGNERRVCQTSRDPNVVKAPGIRLFEEGERELDVLHLMYEVSIKGLPSRPCLLRNLNYSGVEYIASVCSDLTPSYLIPVLLETLFPENESIFVLVLKSVQHKSANDFVLNMFTKPSKNSLDNFTTLGAILINCEVLVNGKHTLANDAFTNSDDFSINETITEQIRSDVKFLEKAFNATPSEFNEYPEFFMFEWTDVDDFILGVPLLVTAVMSQSRRVGPKTAAEMSVINVVREMPEVDILCKEDFFLPRTVSIIIIMTGAVLRLLLVAVPTSLSSAEYALLISGEGEKLDTSTELMEERRGTASV